MQPKKTAYAFVPEIEMIRQNSPPDERDGDATEQDSDGDIEARRSPLVNDKANQKSQVTSEKARWHEDTKCLQMHLPVTRRVAQGDGV